MTIRKLVPLVICSFFLTGCWDHTEPERLLYINGIGINYLDNGEIEVFVQILNLQGLAKSENGSAPTTPVQVGRAVGKTLEDAIFNLYHTVDRRLFWGHLTYVIFSENAIKNGAIQEVSDFLVRYRETRYRIYNFVTKDSIKDVMLIKPLDNISLAFSKLSDPSDNYEQSSFIPPINLRELIIFLDEPGYQVQLPVLKITEQWMDEKKKQKNLLMEEIAVISKFNQIDFVPKKYYLGTRATNKKFTRDQIYFSIGSDQYLSAIVYDKKLDVIPVVKENGRVCFQIELKLKASLQNAIFHTNREEMEKAIETAIKKEMQKSYQYGMERNLDLFYLSTALYRKDNNNWKRVQKNGLVPLEEDTIKSINVKVLLQNTGRNKFEPLFK